MLNMRHIVTIITITVLIFTIMQIIITVLRGITGVPHQGALSTPTYELVHQACV